MQIITNILISMLFNIKIILFIYTYVFHVKHNPQLVYVVYISGSHMLPGTEK